MWLMVTVLDSVVQNFHVFECCWISQIWLYLGLSLYTGDFHYVFGGVAEPVRWWGVHRDFPLHLRWRSSLPFEPLRRPPPPPPRCPGVFSGKREWLVSWSCKVLEWAQGDDGGDFSVLEGQCYFVWICRRENVHHFQKKKSKSAVRRKRRVGS